MDRRSALLVAASLLFSILGWIRPELPARAHAEDAGAPDAKGATRSTRVALVDMGKVFNQSNEFLAGKQAIKERLSSLESDAKAMRDDLVALEKELKQHEAGSEAHKELAATIKKQLTAFNDFRKQAQLEVTAKESELHLQIYKIVREQVQRHAEANGIDLVMRFNEMDDDAKAKQDLKSVMQIVSGSVLYQNQLDITEAIVEAVNHR